MAKTSLKVPYLAITGVVVVAIVVVMMFLVPLYQQVQTVSQQRTEQQATLALRQLFLNQLDRKMADLRTAAQREGELNVTLPEDEAITDVVKLLERLADQSGLVLDRVVNNAGDTAREYAALAARGVESGYPPGVVPLEAVVSVRGSYAQIRAFIDQLERSPRLIDISRFSITSSETAETLSAEINLTFYRYTQN